MEIKKGNLWESKDDIIIVTTNAFVTNGFCYFIYEGVTCIDIHL